jgi:hypothetical protein
VIKTRLLTLTKASLLISACSLVALSASGATLTGMAAAATDAGAQTTTAGTQTTPAGQTTPSTPATTPSTPTSTPTTPATTPSTPPVVKPKPAAPTHVTGLPPGAIADGTKPLVVRLSAAPAPNSPAPALSPIVAGMWKAVGASETFVPKSTLEPCSTYTLTVWAGTDALGHPPLGKARRLHLSVACPGLQALQQALSRLSYLPYSVDASHGRNSGDKAESRAEAAGYAFSPPAARLTANVPDAPGLRYGTLDATTRGAVMVFQAAHGQSPTGEPDSSMWASLIAAETLGHGDPVPYTFVTVSESIPETLEVHRGRHVALSTPANTGVAGATTELGTFPIYARYVSTTMTGTNPDGSHYSDPGVPWVNYFNGGDAVHGFPRASYGTPQSNGCVELPIGTAGQVYPLLTIGDLVVVS